MSFADNVYELSAKIAEYRNQIRSEEGTKMAFILPFISMLGYDVFNPIEVIPEMECDISKKADKIDYAIFICNKPVLLIECKMAGINLDGYVNQMAKYFVASKARFAILTNGVEYRFYSDLRDRNLMDEEPFFSVNLLYINTKEIQFMSKFSKDNFNEAQLLQSARVMSYKKDLEVEVQSILSEPSRDFIKLLISKFYDGIVTNSVLDEFTPMVRDAISDFTGKTIDDTDESQEDIQDDVLPEISEAFDVIKSIILEYDNTLQVVYKVFKTNVRIAIMNKWHYVCKLDFTPKRKRIGFPVGDYKHIEWVSINDTKDIYSLSEYIQNGVIVAKNHLAQYV